MDAYRDAPIRPHLHIPAVLSLIEAIMAMLYENQMELWRKSHMSWLLLVYWITALVAEIIKCVNFSRDEALDGTLLIYDLNIAASVVHSLFLILELYIIVTKVGISSLLHL